MTYTIKDVSEVGFADERAAVKALLKPIYLDLFIRRTILFALRSVLNLPMSSLVQGCASTGYQCCLVANNRRPFFFKGTLKRSLPVYHPGSKSYMMGHVAGQPCFQLEYRILRNL